MSKQLISLMIWKTYHPPGSAFLCKLLAQLKSKSCLIPQSCSGLFPWDLWDAAAGTLDIPEKGHGTLQTSQSVLHAAPSQHNRQDLQKSLKHMSYTECTAPLQLLKLRHLNSVSCLYVTADQPAGGMKCLVEHIRLLKLKGLDPPL